MDDNKMITEVGKKNEHTEHFLLNRNVDFQRLFDAAPDRENAFELEDRHLRCMDERTPGGLHLAGQGILYPNALEDLRGKVDGVLSHEDCGADGVYLAEHKDEIIDPEELADPDKIGDRFSKDIAEKLGVPYLGRIPVSDMDGEKGHHHAQVIYYIGTEGFDPTRVKELPKGFIISRGIISDPKYAIYEAQLAAKIILGGHGLGEKINSDTPIHLVVVGGRESTVEQDVLLKEAEEIAGVDNKIKIGQIIRS